MKKGFTLVEVLLSLALIALIAGISIPVFQGLQTRNDLDVAANTIAQSMKRAQVLAQAVNSNDTWGVYIQEGNVTIFKGTDYASRDMSFDEISSISSTITKSGIDEVIFSEFYGEPQTTGTITLTSINEETRELAINEKGTVNY